MVLSVVNYKLYNYYSIVAFISIIAYLIITEPNFLRFVDIQSKTLLVQIRRYFIIIRLYPRIKWDMYMMNRRLKALKKLQEESEK